MIAWSGPGVLYVWVPGRGWVLVGETAGDWRPRRRDRQRGADSDGEPGPGGADDG